MRVRGSDIPRAAIGANSVLIFTLVLGLEAVGMIVGIALLALVVSHTVVVPTAILVDKQRLLSHKVTTVYEVTAEQPVTVSAAEEPVTVAEPPCPWKFLFDDVEVDNELSDGMDEEENEVDGVNEAAFLAPFAVAVVVSIDDELEAEDDTDSEEAETDSEDSEEVNEDDELEAEAAEEEEELGTNDEETAIDEDTVSSSESVDLAFFAAASIVDAD
ncbi:unnamed protein product [Ambrosiozyma monospora]|uniref:Unnamed protein product n=1 Tax=Ambrosiozyma monospora TaxID=43982 RepID=A0ACB5T862_AMBMO|nr:unnamed protein product [Ambrosiozyma monospora]